MFSGIQFYENEVPNIMRNGGNYAKVKCVPPQPSPLGVKKLAKFIRRGIWVLLTVGSTILDMKDH